MTELKGLLQEVVRDVVLQRLLQLGNSTSTNSTDSGTNTTSTSNSTTGSNSTTLNSTQAGNGTLNSSYGNSSVGSYYSTGHIANFPQFFKLSAFFIAFILFYAITVPLLMHFANKSWQVMGGLVKKLRERDYNIKLINFLTVLWVLYILVIPTAALIVWGMKLAFDPAFSTQFGVGVTLIGLFVLFIFLGFCDWVGHEWHLTKLSVGLFISASIAAFFYCFVVIFLPNYFTYNGTTAIFMALNFIFSSALTYLKTGSHSSKEDSAGSKERFLKMDLLVKAIVDQGSFSNDQQVDDKEKLKRVIEEAEELNRKYFTFTKIFAFIAYLGTFIAYIVVIASQNPKEQNLVGLVHVILLLGQDQMIYWLDNERNFFIIQDWFKCLYQFIMRLLTCFLVNYWLSMQSFAFFLTAIVITVNFVDKMIPPRKSQSASTNLYHLTQQNTVQFQQFVEAQLKEVNCTVGFQNIGQAGQLKQQTTWSTKISLYLGEMAYVVYVVSFIIITISAAKAKSSILMLELHFVNTYHQWLVAVFSVFMSVIVCLGFAWFKYFQQCKYQVDWKLYTGFAVIEALGVGFGFILYSAIEVSVHLIWTSFVFLPAVGLTFIWFIGHWISNDYQFYGQQKESQSKSPSKVETEHIVTEKPLFDNENPQEQQQHQAANNVKHRLAELDKQSFCSDLKKLFCGQYLPRNRSEKDKQTFCVAISNIALLISYTLLTAFIFKPWWVGFTIGMWVGIAQLTLIIFIKYYQTYYQMSFAVQFSLFLALSLFVSWTIILGIYVFAFYSNMSIALIGFCICVFGYAFVFLFSMACLKLMTIQDKSNLPASLRVLLSICFAIMGAFGVLLIIFSNVTVWGQALCGISLYLITALNLQAHRLKVTIGFGFVLLGYSIFVIVFYHDKPSVVLQALSVILIVILLFFVLNFLKHFIENRGLKEKSIFVYSRTLFPTMRYAYSEQKMINANTELIYFCLTMLTFFIWSFLAGILLKVEDRYIGISFTALSVSIMYLYVSDRLKKAIFLESDRFKTANLKFYMNSIAHAIEVKQQWRMDYMQQKQLKGPSSGSSVSAIPSQEQVQKELHHHDQWEELYKIQSSQLDDKLSKVMYFAIRGKDKDPNFQFYDQRIQELEKAMTAPDNTPEKEIDIVLKTKDIKQKEQLFDVQFYAFLNAIMNLKMKNLEEEIKLVIAKWKQEQSNNNGQNIPSQGNNIVTPSQIPIDFKDQQNQIIQEQAEAKRREAEERKRKEEEAQRLIQQNIQRMAEEMQRQKEEFMREQERQKQIEDAKIREDHERSMIEQKMLEDRMLFEAEQDRIKKEQEQRLKEEEAQRVREEMERWRRQQQAEEERKRRNQEDMIKRMQLEEMEKQRRKQEEIARQEEEHRRRQQAFIEEERKRAEDQQKQLLIGGIAAGIQGISVKEQSADDAYLKQEGDKIYQQHGQVQTYQDGQFQKLKALGKTSQLGWQRVRELDQETHTWVKGKRVAFPKVETKIFDQGVSACDIKQGGLGDCYLLSAMSVMAHCRPDLIQKIFHPKSREYQENGLYSLMFFKNRKPVVITIDDNFPTEANNKHAYVKIQTNEQGVREIWPMLIEKGYAKLYGSYPTIEGGLVDEALADLTNGAPYRFDLTDPDVKKMYNSGEFWDKLVFWNTRNYLMGAGSPSGSDTDISPMGIVQGHAYSILDACEIDGTKLLQLRNPWGDETEWKGAWGDSSKEWTERRRRVVYDRMKQRGQDVSEIGKNDGIFWMSFTDFFKNFEQLFLCKFFDEDYTEVSYSSEWSKAKGTAGGCCNFDSVSKNPQLQVHVTGNKGPVEIFCLMQVEQQPGMSEDIGIGFQMYYLKGKKITGRRMPPHVLENNKGYLIAKSVSLDSSIKPLPTPYTLLMSTFDSNQEAKFNFTLWYKKSQGTVTLKEF